MIERDGTSRLIPSAGDERRPFGGNAPPVQVPDAAAAAYARGLADGEARALAELEQRAEALRRELAVGLDQLAKLEERRARESKLRTTELALAVASRIVRERIRADDPVAARALAEALDALPPQESVRARLNPEDLATVRAALGESSERKRVELIPDDTIARGGCIAEGASGLVDARIEMATESVRAAVEGRPAQP